MSCPSSPKSICKCCEQSSTLFGIVDFSKNCSKVLLAKAEIPVHYYRCSACQFIFTPDFDLWDNQTFAKRIYNEEYVLVDPDYVEIRSRSNAQLIIQHFLKREIKPESILDFGGGNGLLAQLLREYDEKIIIDTYDPFNAAFSNKPNRKYDLILSFEVLEHTPNPKATFAEIFSFMKPQTVFFFSTMIQPADMETIGTDWWYIAPRNGHISIHSQKSLSSFFEEIGYNLFTLNPAFHLACPTTTK